MCVCVHVCVCVCVCVCKCLGIFWTCAWLWVSHTNRHTFSSWVDQPSVQCWSPQPAWATAEFALRTGLHLCAVFWSLYQAFFGSHRPGPPWNSKTLLGITVSPLLFYSILGCVLPLQEVALCQSPPSFCVLCHPCSYRSLLPHNIISPIIFWSSDWSYTLYLPLCASNSPSIIFHSGDVSCPFRIHHHYYHDHYL